MISSIKFLMSLRVAISREVDGGAFPPAEQGNNVQTANLSAVDLDIWNEAYIAKIELAGGADVTIDLRNFETLLFEENIALDTVFGFVLQPVLDDPAETDASLVLKGGATDPFSEPFTDPLEGIAVPAGMTVVMMGEADFAGWIVDATHKTLEFSNPGTDDLTVTVTILGGN